MRGRRSFDSAGGVCGLLMPGVRGRNYPFDTVMTTDIQGINT